MTLEYRTSRVTSNVNNGLSVVMMCQCRFILGKKKKEPFQKEYDSWGGCEGVGAGRIWKIFFCSTQICCESKIPLENKFYIKSPAINSSLMKWRVFFNKRKGLFLCTQVPTKKVTCFMVKVKAFKPDLTAETKRG